jgi:hypothetical protein
LQVELPSALVSLVASECWVTLAATSTLLLAQAELSWPVELVRQAWRESVEA